MNKKLFFSIFIIFILIVSPLVSAFGPNTHFAILTDALDQAPDSLIKKTIVDNIDACYNGLEYADVGIFYYYTAFKDYAFLHNYNLVSDMLRTSSSDRERAFAYCYKLHLAMDGVSHNFFVPNAIRKTKIDNYFVHPIQELLIEGHHLDSRANRVMEGHAEFDAFFQKASDRDWSKDAENLNFVIGGGAFYGKAYNPSTTTLFGRIQNVIYMGLTYVVPEQTGMDYYDAAIEESLSVLRGETPSIDPAGADALNLANKEANLVMYILTALFFIVLFFFSWRFGIIGWGKK